MAETEIIHEFAVKNMLVEKYLLGELKGADLEDFEIHMYACPICVEEVKSGRVFVQGLADTGDAPARKNLWQRTKQFVRCKRRKERQ